MMKKILLVIMLLILATSVQGAFTTQVAGTIGTLIGVSSLNGADLTVSITSTDGGSTYVTGSPATGTYTAGMVVLSPSVSLNYSSTYTYKLTVDGVGDFFFNFTTPPVQTLNNSTTVVPAGYYEATDLATVDTDLVGSNIKSGSSIFGITGSLEPTPPELEWGTKSELLYDYNGVLDFCANSEEGGHTDWRVPLFDELTEAMAYHFFPGYFCGTYGFLADTPYASASASAISGYNGDYCYYGINVQFNTEDMVGPEPAEAYARCVR